MSVILCIDGLPLSMSSSDLHALAVRFGSIRRAWIVMAPTGGSLRFGYIEVPTMAAAEALQARLLVEEPRVHVSLHNDESKKLSDESKKLIERSRAMINRQKARMTMAGTKG